MTYNLINEWFERVRGTIIEYETYKGSDLNAWETSCNLNLFWLRVSMEGTKMHASYGLGV